MTQKYASPSNAARTTLMQLAREIRASDLPASTRHAWVQDLFEVAGIIDEQEVLVEQAMQPAPRRFRLGVHAGFGL